MKEPFLRRKDNSTFYTWYNKDGKERCRKLGSDSLEDAEAMLIVGQLGLDKNNHQPDPHNATFGDLLEAWLIWGKTKSGRDKEFTTKIMDETNARLYLRPQWGHRTAKDIQPLEIQEWLDALDLKAKSKIRSTMSAVYYYGQKFGKIPRTEECNPMKWVSAADDSMYEAITVTPEQAFLIVEQLPLFERTLLITVAITGLRMSEVLGLQWKHIEFNTLLIRVLQAWKYGKLGKPKSKASKHPVTMPPVLARLLGGWQSVTPYNKPEDWVFASFKLKGRKPRVGSMIAQDYFRPVATRLGIIPSDCPRFGFHNFRHSLATFLVENGTDPEVVQRMLRHSNLPTTLIYVHNQKQSRAAQERFAQKFLPSGVNAGV